MTWGLVYWPLWIIVSSALFLPVEIYALLTNPANTLSDFCWRELGVNRALEISGQGIAWWASLIMWGFFVVTITLHIWYRYPSLFCSKRN